MQRAVRLASKAILVGLVETDEGVDGPQIRNAFLRCVVELQRGPVRTE